MLTLRHCFFCIQKKDRVMFSPALIFTSLWVLQLLLHAIFHDSFVPFDMVTVCAIGVAVIFFNFGVWLKGVEPPPLGLVTHHDEAYTSALVVRFLNVFFVVYALAGGYASMHLFNELTALGIDWLDIPKIREYVIADFSGDRELYGYFRVFHIGVGFSILFVAYSKHLTKTHLALVLVVGLVSAIITTGRLFMMLYFLSATALLYSAQIVRLRGVALAGLLFVGLFFLIAIVMGKGDNDGVDSLLGSVMWNSQVYVLSSLACFNDFVITDSQRMDGGALLPNSVRELLAWGGIAIPAKPSLLPFSEVPVPCNTYTFMFPLFHDGSFLGLTAGCLLIGFIHQHMYLRFNSRNSPTWSYLYAISIYALVMSVFEDAYFSSPGFWAVLLIPPVAFHLFQKLAPQFWKPVFEMDQKTGLSIGFNKF